MGRLAGPFGPIGGLSDRPDRLGARADHVMAQVDDARSTGAAHARWGTRRFVFTTVGLAAGFSGVAMLTYILTPISVVAAELGFAAFAVIVLVLLVRRAPPTLLREVARSARAGIVAGAVATLAYDASRTILSLFDPLPYQPFEAISRFGLGVLPVGSDPRLVLG